MKDTGVGIPQDMLKKIFDIFTQVDDLFRRHTEGTGIGLSLVKSLVEMHGGGITARSQVGIGSEFIIKLPIQLVANQSNEHKYKADDFNYNMENTKIELSDIYFDQDLKSCNTY